MVNDYRKAKKEFEELSKKAFSQSDDSPDVIIQSAASLIRGIEASSVLRETTFRVLFWQMNKKDETLFYKLVPGKEIIGALGKYGQGDGYRFSFELAELN